MGFWDKAEKAYEKVLKGGNFLADHIGMKEPSALSPEPYKCMDCGVILYFRDENSTEVKRTPAYPDRLCTRGDGKQHCMRRIRPINRRNSR